jgi:hypothetical protein
LQASRRGSDQRSPPAAMQRFSAPIACVFKRADQFLENGKYRERS